MQKQQGKTTKRETKTGKCQIRKFGRQVVENLQIYRGQRVNLAKYKYLQTLRRARDLKSFFTDLNPVLKYR